MTVQALADRSASEVKRNHHAGAAALPGLPESRAGGRWSALRTRSRNERILAVELLRAGVAAWTPTVRRDEQFGARRVTVERPLFPGYVFLHGDYDDVDRATGTGRVLEVIGFADQTRAHRELADLWQALARNAPLQAVDVAGGSCAGDARAVAHQDDRQAPACASDGHGILPVAELGVAAAVIGDSMVSCVQ
jgi:hypothetical protein